MALPAEIEIPHAMQHHLDRNMNAARKSLYHVPAQRHAHPAFPPQCAAPSCHGRKPALTAHRRAGLTGRWRWQLQPRVLRHHALQTNADTFDDGE